MPVRGVGVPSRLGRRGAPAPGHRPQGRPGTPKLPEPTGPDAGSPQPALWPGWRR
jgi:hypothetical protein